MCVCVVSHREREEMLFSVIMENMVTHKTGTGTFVADETIMSAICGYCFLHCSILRSSLRRGRKTAFKMV